MTQTKWNPVQLIFFSGNILFIGAAVYFIFEIFRNVFEFAFEEITLPKILLLGFFVTLFSGGLLVVLNRLTYS